MTRAPHPPRIRQFRKRLLAWYRASKRDLPWRRTSDPYAIWLSEVMLQQTQVATVIPYYERFLERFPSPRALAGASQDEVLSRWSGLGYYSRARNLHRAAKAMVERHGGRVPATYEEIAALPGVGPYTAAAVASIAFGLPHPVLDGNVARVLCRVEALEGDDRAGAVRDRLRELAAAYLEPGSPSDFNQAMMELGATICTPRSPRCGQCPVEKLCRASQAGQPERYPERAPRRKSVAVDWTVALVEQEGRVLLVRSASPGLFEGMWELPWLDRPPVDLAEGALAKYDLSLRPVEEFATLRHSITYRRVTLHAVRCALDATRVREPGANRVWVESAAIGDYGLSSIAGKVFRAAKSASRQLRLPGLS